MNKLPAEIVASLLAVTTIFISMTAFHFPPWAIFITWAATFAAGGPTSAVMKKFYPTMAIGGFFACAIVVCFKIASQYFTGNAYLVAECVILFTLNATMMSLGRISTFSFIPGMFFGFASFFATYFGKFGPIPGDPYAALFASLAMNALGPIYAWITATFGAHHHAPHPQESASTHVKEAVS
jgi:hypothetical protein